MLKQMYIWKRFLFPRGQAIDLSDGGYLRDPESQWSRLTQLCVTTFDALSSISCLILLGEPGSGKTETMRIERQRITNELKEHEDDLLWIDLSAYSSEDRLVHSLFESVSFVSWVKGSHRLHLFLDSFDECLLRIDTIAAILAEELSKYPLERLSFRIACRTANWPMSLERALHQLWQRHHETPQVYELAPLRRKDVVEAAHSQSMKDPEKFLKAVERKGVVPFALKPVTLDFLLNIYCRKATLPSSQAELYHEGCLSLCTETNPNRSAARRTGTLSPEERTSVAARIAAIMVFTK